MSRWIYFHRLTFWDIRRLWPSVVIQVFIVAGICLPILLLQSLKHGQIAELREDLLRTPTARQIKFSCGQVAKLLTAQDMTDLADGHPEIEVVIPEVLPRQATFVNRNGDSAERSLEDVTLFATAPGDALLEVFDIPPIESGKRAVVLNDYAAKQLDAAAGDALDLVVRRSGDTQQVGVTVHGVFPASKAGEAISYLPVEIHENIEKFLYGHRIADYGWPSSGEPAKDRYAGYMAFCRKPASLSGDDLDILRAWGLLVDPVENADQKSLFGLVRADDLNVYFLHSPRSHQDPRSRSAMSPRELAELAETLSCNPVFIYWNEPQMRSVADEEFRLVGLALPRRAWLRSYLSVADCAFSLGADEFSVSFPFRQPAGLNDGGSAISLKFDDHGQPYQIDLQHVPLELPDAAANQADVQSPSKPAAANPRSEHSNDDPPDKNGAPSAAPVNPVGRPPEPPPEKDEPGESPNSTVNNPGVTHAAPAADQASDPVMQSGGELRRTAVVPMNLLAHLDAYRHRTVDYDPAARQFVRIPREITYHRARLFTRTIDDVPRVEQILLKRKFAAIESESARITEILEIDASLSLMVKIVGGGVLLFGIVTLTFVLLDSTHRKRGTLGILRVMGVSKQGVFYLVFLRAAIIGLLAGVLTGAVGTILAGGLNSQGVDAVLPPGDIGFIFLAAITSCVVGSIYPAWRASCVDPFDAIVESRFL